jgi:hypothetical protein
MPKTMAFDPKTREIYLSTGDVDTIASENPSQRAQRKMVAGSFEVLVAAPK